MPADILLGCFKMNLKSLGLMPNAIPNMINPRQMFKRIKLSSENTIDISGREEPNKKLQG